MLEISNPSSPVDADIRAIQERAYSFGCLNAWFGDNYKLFGISPANPNLVSISFDIEWSHLYPGKDLRFEDAFMPLCVNIEYTENLEKNFLPEALQSKSLEHSRSSNLSYPLELPLEQWPFITAALAAYYLFSPECKPDNMRVRCFRNVLEHYIPRHFPNMTLETLRTLHSADLLDLDPVDKIERLGRMLMATRAAPDLITTAQVPNDLIL